ncbi:Uncharacterized membrane protein [Streptomyces sp. yr375]|uniref:hypothetical protein n=1 Tax=Streptomyces sp. yr375 TaxID=1761906 RepID=UPI0008CC0769|nr:hypothetical protein [Streptomyces sp. yr375]SES12735.1 Uncharacterized membrane protein [Streptomyces sp. yr375]
MAPRSANRWDGMLPPPRAAQEWEAIKPGLAAEIFEESIAEERHRRRMETLRVGTKILGQFLALGSVGLMVLFAKYALDAGEPIVAGFATGAPSVSLAVIFALSRTPGRRLEEGVARAGRRGLTAVTAGQGTPAPVIAQAPPPGADTAQMP